jgi:FlaA1/EpsC-like NDP-sugar epimerase
MAFILWVIVVALALMLFRKWVVGKNCSIRKDLKGQVVFITGGNDGLGKVTATQLAKMGAQLIIAARD